jgi:predicted nucleotidyltransferase/uncharacterized protein with HEPN domain
MIKNWIKDDRITEEVCITSRSYAIHLTFRQGFVNRNAEGNVHKCRAALLMEFSSVAENLNVHVRDPIRHRYPDFWKAVKDMHGIRNIIMHKYGISDDILDYRKVWEGLTKTLPKQVEPPLDILIEALHSLTITGSLRSYSGHNSNTTIARGIPAVTYTQYSVETPTSLCPLPNSRVMTQRDVRTVPTTDLNVDFLRSLCHPTLDAAKSEFPPIVWAGVFGSVGRGTQRPNSDVDIMVGFSRDADFMRDVCGSIESLKEGLAAGLGREVDVVHFIDGSAMGHVHLEALLAGKTIWGDPSWLTTNATAAERQLRDEYATTLEATTQIANLQSKLALINVSS